MKFSRFKIILIFLLACICGLVFNYLEWSAEESILFSWLTFGGLYVLESVLVILLVPSRRIVKQSAEEDLGVWLQFILLVIICSTALFTIISWNSDDVEFHRHNRIHEVLFIGSVALSWFVLHFSFTFRYAHLYYGDENEKYSKHTRGLDFPDDSHPDYLDFAYYAFTIGMTFQVSDVVVKSKGMRRLTLAHSLVSFLFNTILVAITINEIINL